MSNIKETLLVEINKNYVDEPITMEDFNEEFLEYFDPWEYIESSDRDSHRWWDEITCVKKVGDKWFQYTWAEANRDESIFDLGWSFDYESLIEVEPYEETITITKYRPIK